jgi:hypothetical protein
MGDCCVISVHHVVRVKPISVSQALLSTKYASCSKLPKLPKHSVEASGAGLTTVKPAVSDG